MPRGKKTIIEPLALSSALEQALREYKLVYISAPIGWGKTEAVRWHFRNRRRLYVSLMEEGGLERAERGGAGLTLLDDCHALFGQTERQERLLALLRRLPEGSRAVLLSRAPLPEYLIPLQTGDLLTTLSEEPFRLGTGDAAALAAALGVELSIEDAARLRRESQGYPLAAKLICLELAAGRPLTSETVQSAYEKLFSALDRELFRYWDGKIRRLLLTVSFLDSFTVELARLVSGDRQAERTLERLQGISGFIDRRGGTYAIRYAPFRAYLRRKAEVALSRQERSALLSSAGTYYQRAGDLPAALRCWAADGNHAKVSRLLAEHARLHPGHGAYYQLREYYRGLPEEEILSSPELMSGMSILCSLTLDPEGSERWYGALRAYAGGLSRRSRGYREAQGLLSYLDIALPHRGSAGVRELLLAVYGQMMAGKLRLPEFSVTSNLPSVLRGGKDFSAWVLEDRKIYDAYARPVSFVLGRQGVGLPDAALAESRYEKGEDVSDAYPALASRYAEIQRGGTPEMEFVVLSLLAWGLCDKGALPQAVSDMTAFRNRMKEGGQKQLLPNIDALLCRLDLLGNGEAAYKWFVERAPDENDFFIMDRYRYLTKARCCLQRRDCLTALALLGRLLDYFTRYDRTLDRIEALALLAICRRRMDARDWREYLSAALELGERYGYVTVFAHEGAALLPLLRDWPEPERPERRRYLARVRKAARAFGALYPDYLRPAGSGQLHPLSKKELEVLRLICLSKSNEEIRAILGVSENTLKTHIRKLFKKLNAENRTQAQAAAGRLGIL